MAEAEVSLRLSLKERREVAKGLQDTRGELADVADAGTDVAEAGHEASKGLSEASDPKHARNLGKVKDAAKGLGKAVGSGLKKAATIGLGAVAAGVGLVGIAVGKGFQRLTGIENATAKLDGLGHSAKSVDKIMANSLDSVRGTAFGMDEAASTAAGAVAAGVKPGKDLRKTLKLVADAATIGGTSMSEMGAIFNKVATTNKVQGDVLAQLGDRGIPIVQLLAEELGVTSDAVMEMSRKGMIGFDTFRKAMDRGMGGAALESGKTTQGALKNVGSAAGRFGAGLLVGVFPLVKKLAGEAIVVIDGLTERLAPLMDRFNATMGPKMAAHIEGSGERILGWVDRMSEKVGTLYAAYRAGGLSAVFDGLKPQGIEGTDTVLSSIGDSFGEIGDAVGRVDWTAVKENFGTGVSDTVTVFSTVIGFAADNVDTLAKYLPALVAGLIAYKAAQALSNTFSLAGIPIQYAQVVAQFALAGSNRALATQMAVTNGVQTRGRIATIASTVATGAQTVATKVAAVAQRGLNLAMRMNPIGLVVAGVMLLVGGFILLYKKSETFRGMVDGLWSKVLKPFGQWLGGVLLKGVVLIGKAFLSMASFGIRAFTGLLTAAFTAFDGILSAAEKGLGWIPGLGDKISGAREKFNEFGDAAIGKLNGMADGLDKAKTKLDELDKKRAKPTIEYQITSSGSVPRGVTHSNGDIQGVGGRSTARATGGPVAAGRGYWVGERGPEWFESSSTGRITPAHTSARLAAPALRAAAPLQVDTAADISAVLDQEATLTAGPAFPGEPVTVQVVLDGKVLAESVLDNLDDRAARR